MTTTPHTVEPSWLVKDFHALYRAADAAVKSTQDGPCPGPEHVALQVHLTRLRPAFEMCEAERRSLAETPRQITHELVPDLDPDAYALEVEEKERGERRVTNRCRHPLVVVRKGAEKTPEPLPPGARAVLGPEDFVAQPTTPCVHGRLELAHDKLREGVQAAALAWLESWDDGEPDPDELPAERKLYDAVVALRAFEIDAKLAAERAAGDEHEEPTLTGAEPQSWRECSAALDAGMRVDMNDGDLGPVLNEILATTSPPFPDRTFRACIQALARQLDDIPERAHHRCEASPRMPGAVLRALLSHPQVAEADDDDGAGGFLAFALRGAQLGWHVRQVHPSDVRKVATIGAPIHEPHRSSWLDGYRIGAELIVAPLNLTDTLRAFYDTHLVYRAPETLTAREREIISAVEAERGIAAP